MIAHFANIGTVPWAKPQFSPRLMRYDVSREVRLCTSHKLPFVLYAANGRFPPNVS